MSDVNTFIESVGKDVSATVVPRVQGLADTISAKALTDYGPKVSAFTNQLVKEIIDEQSATVRDFATALIQDLFHRYRPELVGELHARLVRDGLEVTGQGIRLDLKRRDTGESVSSLDIPVSVTVKVDALAVTLQNTTIKLDIVR
jgi:NADH:ubiquinone oxidoreductase subunit D